LRWSSLNTRPELAEAARRLRQLSCSRRAELGMHGSQAVRSLLIGFSRARAARVVERAHLTSVGRPSPNSIATASHAASHRKTVALRWVRANQRAARPLQRRGHNTGSRPPGVPAPDPVGPAAIHCYGAASTAAGQRHLPSALIEVGCHPEPAASARAVS
jgi:hypothetical protein